MAIFVVVVALLFLFLDWYIEPTEPKDRKDLVLTLAQILGGTALLSGLYFTWRTLQVNRQGQITERFTRAIDQLGSTNLLGERRIRQLEIRLGGIYALEQIAKEAKEYYWPIMEILTAYVREVAKDRTAPGVDIDIQATMTVLGRRTGPFGAEEPEPLDLHGANLPKAHLPRVDLMNANLSGVNLNEANLVGADLMGADLSGAQLTEADLFGANLVGAKLIEADLTGAKLDRVDLTGADLSGADLREAAILGYQLERATGDEKTRLPPYFTAPSDWGVEIDEQNEGD